MDKNKADACNIRKLTDKKNYIQIVENYISNRSLFYYDCSFCFRELPNGGIRFAGLGACPYCFAKAQQLINALQEHAANYFNNGETQR
jgi:hypothetical protein